MGTPRIMALRETTHVEQASIRTNHGGSTIPHQHADIQYIDRIHQWSGDDEMYIETS